MNTRPGARIRMARILASMGVSGTGRPAFSSRMDARSSDSSPPRSTSSPARAARRSWAFTRATTSMGLKGLVT